MISICKIESKSTVAKSFEMKDGVVVKRSAAQIVEGNAIIVSFADLAAFGRALDRAGPNTSVTYGTPERDAPLTTAAMRTNGEIARTREFFSFRPRVGGVMFLDVDNDPRPPAEIYTDLTSAAPWLKGTQMLWRPSSSSGINGGPIKGHHFYLAVDNAGEIPRIGKRLECNLWIAGQGRIDIGSAGQLLARTLVDTSVWQPERLDFIAAPILRGVTRDVPPAQFFGDGGPLVSAAVENGDEAGLKQLIAKAKALKRPSALPIQRAHAVRIANRLGTTAEAVMALHRGMMPRDFVLHMRGGGAVTCGEILANPAAWDGKRFADPLEPDYGGDDRIAVCEINPNGAVRIYSHAHGGQNWVLKRASGAVLASMAEEVPSGDTDKTPLLLRSEAEQYADVLTVLNGADVFNGAAGMAAVAGGKIDTLTAEDVRRRIVDEIDFYAAKVDKKTGERSIELAGCPARMHTILHGLTAPLELRQLDGVSINPVVVGEDIHATPGYQPESALWLALDADYSERVTARQGCDDLEDLLSEFRFSEQVDLITGVALLMTAVLRKSMPTAPGWLIDAPRPQSGKTYLAELAGALACGYIPPARSMPGDEAECGKKITAALLEGEAAIIFDDLKRDLPPYPALCSMFTSERLSDRLLGATRSISVSTQTTVIFTGNNVAPGLDLARRIVPLRLDPRTADPQSIRYSSDPVAAVMADRRRYVTAVLSILDGYWSRVDVRPGLAYEGSYRRWQALVREPLWWLTGQDVLQRLNANRENSGVPEDLLALLEAITALMGRTTWVPSDLLRMQPLGDALCDCLGAGKVSAKSLGWYLKRYVDFETSAGTLRRVRRPDDHTKWEYRVEAGHR